MFSKHDLGYLVNKLDPSRINITEKEKNILKDLTPYVIWAGRYPLPKYKNEIIAKCHDSAEHKRELELWEKLKEYLANISWIMKGASGEKGYHELYMRNHE